MTLRPFSGTRTRSFALTIANKLVIEPLPLDCCGRDRREGDDDPLVFDL